MKIEKNKSIVEFIPESEAETAALQTLWETVVDCSKFSRKLAPIGEYIPQKNNAAQFHIEGLEDSEASEARFGSVDDILDFAIAEEAGAYVFYMDLGSKMEKEWMKKVFEDFAEEEIAHKRELQKIKEGKVLAAINEKVSNLKISDYLVEADPSTEYDYQDALILAMRREKAAFKLYSDLAEVADDERARNLLLALAQEEAKHKLRFELEYDENILLEN